MLLAGTDDAMLPMLICRGSVPPPPANGDAIFVRTPGGPGGSGSGSGSGLLPHHGGCPGPAVTAGPDSEEDVELAPPPMPEMRDMECQTRESLFHNNNSSLSNHNDPSRSNSERSNTPPPPPPPTISRLVNMKNSRNVPRPAPFSTFGYVDSAHGHGHGSGTMPRRGPPPAPGHHHPHHHEDPGMRFRAEAVIEMDQKSSSSSSGAGGGGGGGPGAGAGPGAAGSERPFSMDSTKSAPDVIVTH